MGFNVCDAQTGEPVEPVDVVRQSLHSGIFAINENGNLMVIFIDLWNDTDAVIVQKRGDYLIKFADGRSVQW